MEFCVSIYIFREKLLIHLREDVWKFEKKFRKFRNNAKEILELFEENYKKILVKFSEKSCRKLQKNIKIFGINLGKIFEHVNDKTFWINFKYVKLHGKNWGKIFDDFSVQENFMDDFESNKEVIIEKLTEINFVRI